LAQKVHHSAPQADAARNSVCDKRERRLRDTIGQLAFQRRDIGLERLSFPAKVGADNTFRFVIFL
jgi:hypothetical protein